MGKRFCIKNIHFVEKQLWDDVRGTLLCWLWQKPKKRFESRQKRFHHHLAVKAWAGASPLSIVFIHLAHLAWVLLTSLRISSSLQASAFFTYKNEPMTNPQSHHCLCHTQSFSVYFVSLQYPSSSLPPLTFPSPPGQLFFILQNLVPVTSDLCYLSPEHPECPFPW